MTPLLWGLQVGLAVVFLIAGAAKLLIARQWLATHLHYLVDLSDGQARAIGGLEVMGAAGLSVPLALGALTVLTSIAASGIALLMLAAARTHVRRHESHMLPVNLGLGAAAVLLVVLRLGHPG